MRKSGMYAAASVVKVTLQCGRIYKDAEIDSHRSNTDCIADDLQCGRIYKDAEMGYNPGCISGLPQSFNVAASIKMRKLKYQLSIRPSTCLLQCGRIYKDAEIYVGPSLSRCTVSALQCGRIYKDAEIPDVVGERYRAQLPSMWPHL